MTMIDIILIVIVAGFVFFGLFFGFVHTLGSLIGSIFAIFASSRLIDPVMIQLGPAVGDGAFARISVFFLLFFFISRAIGILFWFLDKFMNVAAFIPMVRTANRAAGGVLGFIEGVIVVGIGLFYISQFLPLEVIQQQIEGSAVANWLVTTTRLFSLLLPPEFRGQL